MLKYKEARKIGLEACIDKLGRDFVQKYKDTMCTGYAGLGSSAFCFVGVDDKPRPEWNPGDPIVLSSDPEEAYPYIARCYVDYADGRITFGECVLPQTGAS